jgi:phosphatidylglycerophosphate synthase
MNVQQKLKDFSEDASKTSQQFFQWLMHPLEFWICTHWPDTRPYKDQRVEGKKYVDTRPWLVRNCANVITTIRLATFWIVVLGLVSSTTFWGRAGWILGAAALIVSDGIDGELARGLSIESRYGKVVDPLADKLLVVSIAIALVCELVAMYGWRVAPLVLVTAATAFHEVLLATTGGKVGVISRRLDIDPQGSVTAGKVKFGFQGLAIVLGWLCLGVVGAIIATFCLTVALHFSMQSRKAYIDQLNMFREIELSRASSLRT